MAKKQRPKGHKPGCGCVVCARLPGGTAKPPKPRTDKPRAKPEAAAPKPTAPRAPVVPEVNTGTWCVVQLDGKRRARKVTAFPRQRDAMAFVKTISGGTAFIARVAALAG